MKRFQFFLLFLTASSVWGHPSHFYDPYANDQDCALAFYLQLTEQREQNPLDLWSLVPEGSQETCLDSAESRRKKTEGQLTEKRDADTSHNGENTKGSGWVDIVNGQLWTTDKGQTVQAHAPGFVRKNGLWYMVGEDRSHPWNPDVNLYASPDLVHWTFVKKIIENGITDSRMGRSRMIERAKLLYCEKTGKWVVWCHWESKDYSASEAACFVSDSVGGDYRLVWSGRPMGIKSRDCNVFVDHDGTAYFISTTNENQDLGLFRLADDYLSVVEHTCLFPGEGREAPAIVRVGDRYFMFSSACTGWVPNQCKLSYSDNLKTGWSPLENIGDDKAFRTQAAAILEVKGSQQTTYLYVGDRWMDPDLPRTKTIMFPILFDGTRCIFDYRDRFSINFDTGEWHDH